MMLLPVLPVALPLLGAALLAGLNKHVARAVGDAIAIAIAAVVTCTCAFLTVRSAHAPIAYWFGGISPRAGVSLGISFAIDPLGAGLATLSALLVTCAFVFSIRFFEDAELHFHALLLAFLAALCGFSLTGDLFNLFVFFELMSAAAFALCGYKTREEAPIQGALNFAVTNTVGAFLVLFGIALLYARSGALNMAQIGRALEASRAHDPLVVASFALIACGFAVKASLAPFHTWLPDAHAAAPTPVCILFSGVMVEAGLYAIFRVHAVVFGGVLAGASPAIRGVLLVFGAATALLAALMCFAQRHLKRLLAFSTISHVGVMTLGLALLEEEGTGGVATYVVGHGLVKAALFLLAGIVLHRLRSVDEIALRGRGKRMVGVGLLFALAGLALAGLPPFATFAGEHALDSAAKAHGHAWIVVVRSVASIVTAAAVLRAGGRIFLGLGPAEPDAPEVGGEPTEEPETARDGEGTPLTMWIPVAVLLSLAIAAGLVPAVREVAVDSALRARDATSWASWLLDGAAPSHAIAAHRPVELAAVLQAIGTSLLACLLAVATLLRKRLPNAIREVVGRAWDGLMLPLRAAHTGRVGDDVAWLAVGVALFGGWLLLTS